MRARKTINDVTYLSTLRESEADGSVTIEMIDPAGIEDFRAERADKLLSGQPITRLETYYFPDLEAAEADGWEVEL
jgi:hypothetical protein